MTHGEVNDSTSRAEFETQWLDEQESVTPREIEAAWSAWQAAKQSIPSQSAQAEAVALLTVAHKDDPIWRGMNFIGPTAFGKTLPAGKYELYVHPSAREAALEKALRPFANVTLTDTGVIIGLMREDIERARAALGEGK